MTDPTGGNGRNSNGRFAKGNKAAHGNPYNKKVQQIRASLIKGVTAAEVRAIARRVIDAALSGDRDFIKEFYDRTGGRPVASDLLERLERLEEIIVSQNGGSDA